MLCSEYRGTIFKKYSEAQFAVFLDYCGADWEYNPNGHDIANGYSYPQFLIHNMISPFTGFIAEDSEGNEYEIDNDVFIEIRNDYISGRISENINEFRSNNNLYILSDFNDFDMFFSICETFDDFYKSIKSKYEENGENEYYNYNHFNLFYGNSECVFPCINVEGDFELVFEEDLNDSDKINKNDMIKAFKRIRDIAYERIYGVEYDFNKHIKKNNSECIVSLENEDAINKYLESLEYKSNKKYLIEYIERKLSKCIISDIVKTTYKTSVYSNKKQIVVDYVETAINIKRFFCLKRIGDCYFFKKPTERYIPIKKSDAIEIVICIMYRKNKNSNYFQDRIYKNGEDIGSVTEMITNMILSTTNEIEKVKEIEFLKNEVIKWHTTNTNNPT